VRLSAFDSMRLPTDASLSVDKRSFSPFSANFLSNFVIHHLSVSEFVGLRELDSLLVQSEDDVSRATRSLIALT